MSWPRLSPTQLQNPTAHVVEPDVRELRGLVLAHRAELAQWRKTHGLSSTALAICAVLASFRGLRSGRDGCGVQLSARAWAAVLGVSQRMVGYAFEQLALEGLVWRRRRLVRHDWVDAAGTHWQHAEINAVAYLSKLGHVRLARRGSIRIGAKQVSTGLAGAMLRTLASKIRMIAARVTDAEKRFRPTAVKLYKSQKRTAKRGSPVGSALDPSSHRRAPAAKASGASANAAGTRVDQPRLLALWRRQRLTPANAWPELWTKANAPYRDERGHWWERNTKQRRWLIRECEKLAMGFSRAELERLVASKAIR